MTLEVTTLPTKLDCQEEPYAFFLLDNQEFGLKAEQVRETILYRAEFTRIPCSVSR